MGYNTMMTHGNERGPQREASGITGLPAVRQSVYESLKSIHALVSAGKPLDSQQQPQSRADKIRSLAFLISQLEYEEYLVLENITHGIRNGQTTDLGELVQQYQESFPRLACILGLLQSSQGRPNFDSDAVLLVRAAYPFGKNVVNKTQDPKNPLGCRTSEHCEIKTAGTTLTVNPAPDGGCVVSAEGKSVKLNEGQCGIFGRDMVISSVFGVSVERLMRDESRTSLEMRSMLPVSDTQVSRAGIMLVVHGGQLYIFDRGSQNPVTVEQGKLRIKYDPNAIGRDGTRGESVMF